MAVHLTTTFVLINFVMNWSFFFAFVVCRIFLFVIFSFISLHIAMTITISKMRILQRIDVIFMAVHLTTTFVLINFVMNWSFFFTFVSITKRRILLIAIHPLITVANIERFNPLPNLSFSITLSTKRNISWLHIFSYIFCFILVRRFIISESGSSWILIQYMLLTKWANSLALCQPW